MKNSVSCYIKVTFIKMPVTIPPKVRIVALKVPLSLRASHFWYQP